MTERKRWSVAGILAYDETFRGTKVCVTIIGDSTANDRVRPSSLTAADSIPIRIIDGKGTGIGRHARIDFIVSVVGIPISRGLHVTVHIPEIPRGFNTIVIGRQINRDPNFFFIASKRCGRSGGNGAGKG